MTQEIGKVKVKSNSLPSSNTTTGAVKVGINNQNAQRVQSIQYSPGSSIDTANNAFEKANNAYDLAVVAYNTGNAAYSTANASYSTGNSAYLTANIIFAKSNTDVNNTNSYISSNVATLRGEITANAASANSVINTNISSNVSTLRGEISSNTNSVFAQANAAYATANAAFESANNVFPQISPAFSQANAAYATANASYAQANSSYGNANTKVSKSGDTMTGTLFLTAPAPGDSLTVANNTGTTLSITREGHLTVFGQANVYERLAVGTGAYTSLPNLISQFTGNSELYSQVNQQNMSANGTGDFVITTNNGTDTVNYADMGMAGNTYNNTTFNAFSFVKPNDGYFMIIGNDGQDYGGNVFYGTTGSGGSTSNVGDITFVQGSNYDEVGTFVRNQGLVLKGLTPSTSNSTGSLVVQGGIGANGAIRGDSIYDSGSRIIHVAQAAFDKANTSSGTANAYTDTANTNLKLYVDGNITANVSILRVEITANAASANSVINSRISANVATLRGEITANAAAANSVTDANISANVVILRGEISSNVSTLRGEITANAASSNSVINTNISANVATLRGEITANANLVYAQANTAYATANAAYATANAAYESANNVFPQIAPAFAQANAAYAQGNTTITNTNSYISSNVAILRGEITANAVSANSVINTNISANVANLQSEITANAVSANSVINTNISANVALLRGEISSNVLTLNVYSQAAYAQANTGNTTAQAAFDKANTGPSYLVTALATGSNNRITVSAPTGNVSIDLATIPTITSGTYTYPSLIVDSYGRITSITTQTPVTSISANSNSTITQTATSGEVHFDLAPSGVSAGTYGSAISIPTIVVDTYGRLTNVTANSVSTTINLAGNTGTGTVSGNGTLTLSGSNSISTSVSSGTFTITNNGILSFNTRTGVVSLTSSDVTTALGYTPANKAGDTVSGNFTGITTLGANNVTYAHSTTFSTTFTTSTTSPVTIDSFPITSYRSAKYFVQLTSSTSYHVIELSLVHNGTSVYLAQYGEVFTSASLGTFDASIVTGQLNLTFTGANAVTTVKLIRDVINI